MYSITDIPTDPLEPASPRITMRKNSLRSRPPLAPPLQDPAPQHCIVTENDVENLFCEAGKSLDGYLLEEEKKDMDARSSLASSWRSRQKVASTDVASVGNASDTSVSIDQGHQSGRDLHEAAKLALNAGNFVGALTLFESILSAQMERFGPCHASVAAAMHNVGVCRQRMGQHELAENLFAESVQIRQQTLGPENIEVAASLSKLGSTRVALSKFDEAFDDLRRALKIATSSLGPDHKTVAQISSHLACLYFEKGELFAAQATFEDALETYRLVWASQQTTKRDSTMIQLTDTLCNIGSIQNRRKQHAQAIQSFSQSLDLQRGVFEHDHPRIVQTLDNLGYSYSKNKEYDRALVCYKNMRRIQLSHYGTFNGPCLESFRKQVLMHEKLKETKEAIRETKELLSWQKTKLPAEHTIVRQTKTLLDELTKRKKKTSSNHSP